MGFETTLVLDSSTASGISSNFTVYFNPPIELDTTKTYELALISANIWYSWHNIHKRNNKFRYSPNNGSTWVDIRLPSGAYNIIDINAGLKRLIEAKGHKPDNISIEPDYNTLKSRIVLAENYQVDFQDKNSAGNLRSILGFDSELLDKDGSHDSDNIVDITPINSVSIRCSLINSSYINGSLTNIIHSFSPTSPPGYLMNIQPRNLIYLPITKQSQISELSIRITDQRGEEINLNGERTSFYISLKEQ